MTNWLLIFLVLYLLVMQPVLFWRIFDNYTLFWLAWLNLAIFLLAWIISQLSKKNKSKNWENTVKLTEKTEEKISKIENNNGVSLVEIEKKEESIVEAVNEKQEENTEKLEEKNTEKKSEVPMKETVSIPKIVQPLTGYSSKKKKKDLKWWQRVILLITLCLVTVIAWTLWEFLGNRWIAIALFLWWILYLVIGKLFDIDGFYNAKKLFTNWLYVVLILAGIWYGIYSMQQVNKSILPPDFSEKLTTYMKNLFESDDEKSESEPVEMKYIFEWTGEVITDIESNIENLDNTWTIEDEKINEEVNAWVVENDSEIEVQPENETQPEAIAEAQPSIPSAEDSKTQVTMWEAVKSLLAWAKLSTKTNTTFKHVSKSSELYPYFKTAQEKWMIWTDTDPSKIVSCETFITMKWIREWRNVWTYSKDEIKTAYRNKATQLWKLNWCKKTDKK